MSAVIDDVFAAQIVDEMAFPIDTANREQMLKILNSCIGTKYTARFGSLMAVRDASNCRTLQHLPHCHSLRHAPVRADASAHAHKAGKLELPVNSRHQHWQRAVRASFEPCMLSKGCRTLNTLAVALLGWSPSGHHCRWT